LDFIGLENGIKEVYNCKKLWINYLIIKVGNTS
jgi:hypothetical protein